MEERDELEDLPPGSLEERIEGWIRVMLAESMLGPLLFVILCHAGAFLAPALVLAFRDRHLAALALVSILVVATGSALHRDWQRYRRPGPIGGVALAAWTIGGVMAWLAGRFGIL